MSSQHSTVYYGQETSESKHWFIYSEQRNQTSLLSPMASDLVFMWAQDKVHSRCILLGLSHTHHMSTSHLSQPPKNLIQEEPTKMKIKPNHEVEKKKKKKKGKI